MKIHLLAIIGAGERGRWLGTLVSKTARAKITAVVEPDETKRVLFAKEFDISKEHCYRDCQHLIRDRVTYDGVFVTTPPNSHAEITCAVLEAGIPVFLEKPMANNLREAGKIVETVKKTGVRLQVGFNCRYIPFFVKIKELVASGKIGEVLSLEWKEVITPHHWSTYCRSPSYNRSNVIGSWLLEKCCHDLDLMNWIVASPCIRVASFGSRSHFIPRTDLPKYCTDGCPIEKECFFSALKFHPDLKDEAAHLPEYEKICVYNSGSDLVDHQVSILEYANGVTAAFSLLPLGVKNTRFVYICGTTATLKGSWIDNEIRIFPYDTKKEIVCDPGLSVGEGHGGGDSLIVFAFLDWLDDSRNEPKTKIENGWEAMVIGSAIDVSLKEHRIVDLSIIRGAFDC